MSDLSPLLDRNRAWASNVGRTNPGLLATLASGQTPKILWIGCSDSRCPESTITASLPGEIFVHRNIANQFIPTDASANAVLSYAVAHLGVSHVIIAGHSSCGGCQAAFSPGADSPVMQWLAPLIQLRASMPEGSVDDLIRENVRMGVRTVAESAVVKDAWRAGRQLWVHGWKYDIASGVIEDLGMTLGAQA